MDLHISQRARVVLAGALLATSIAAQLNPGDVIDEALLDGNALGATLEIGDGFGHAVARLGDVDGDGVGDIAIGAPGDGAGNAGAVWIVLLNPNGTVRGATRLASDTAGIPSLDDDDAFGSAVAGIGDLDDDGVPDVAIGAPGDDGNDANVTERGAVWIAFLQEDGSARSVVRLADGTPGLGVLTPHGSFGDGLAPLPDIDGDGFDDLFVGATSRSLQGDGKGKGFILSLSGSGAVLNAFVIDENVVPGGLATGDLFGSSAAALGDLDGDGIQSIAIGSRGANGGYGFGAGRVVLFEVTSFGTLASSLDLGLSAEISLDGGDQFGASMASLGDLDGDGVDDIIIGAEGDDDGGTNLGAAYVFSLSTDGEVVQNSKISSTTGGFDGPLPAFARFGAGLTVIDDLNGDEVVEFVVGAPGAASGWLLYAQGFKDDGKKPFPALTPALDGRPGRAGLALPPSSGIGDDKIDDPFVGVPGLDKKSVFINTPLIGPEQSVVFIELDEIPTGDNPAQALTSDFSDDDRDDIITANSGSDSLSYLEATGPGAPGFFDPKPELPLPSGFTPISVTSDDFGNGPPLDVVAAGAGGLFGYFGSGAGTFTAMPAIPFVDLLTDVVSGDVDGDGDNDLITASGALAQAGIESGFVTVLLNDGAGNFTINNTFATGQAVVSVLLGDFDTIDAGNNLDVLVAIHEFLDPALNVPQGRIELWVGDGTGSFTISSLFAGVVVPNANGSHPTYGAIGDIDSDGTLDAVYTTSDNISHPSSDFADAQAPLIVTSLVNDGAGSFDVVTVGTAYSGKSITPILLDLAPEPAGNLDLILIWYQDLLAGTLGTDIQTFLGFLVGAGDGFFFDPAPNQFLTGEEPGNGDVRDVGSADVDGSPDLIIPSLKGNDFTVFVNDGTADFTPAGTFGPVDDFVAPPFFEGGPWDLRVADLNDDDIADVLIHNLWMNKNPLPAAGDLLGASSVSAFVGDAAGGFTRSDYEPLTGIGEIVVVDLDGDGRDDAVVTARGRDAATEGVRVLRATGNGTLGAGMPIAPPAGLTLSGGIAAADVTGDGAPDIITAAHDSAGAGSVVVYPNVTGGLGAPTSYTLGGWTDVRSLSVEMFDADGTLDVAIGCLDGRLIIGTGVVGSTGAIVDFALLETDPTTADVGGGALGVGDVNGDGRSDVISSADGSTATSGLSQSQVHSLVASDLVGAYAVETLAGTSSAGVLGALRPLLADLDGDETTDLVLTHGTSSAVSILPNQLTTFAEFGEGKAGKGGIVPRMFGLGYTTPAGKLSVNVEGGLGGAEAIVIISANTAPNGPGFLHVGMPLGAVLTTLGGAPEQAGAGTLRLAGRLPPETSIVGLPFVFQAFIADPFAPGSAAQGHPILAGMTLFSATNGLRFTVVQ